MPGRGVPRAGRLRRSGVASAAMSSTISRSRLTELLQRARGRRIAVVGDAMLDVYLRGDVDRISPEAPVPVVRVRERRFALGGAANVAQNVAALGAVAELVTVIGDDAAGERISTMLDGLGADGRSLVYGSRPTTTKTRLLARSQQVVRFDEEEDADLSGPDMDAVHEAVGRAVCEADALVLEDYNKGVLTASVIERAVSLAAGRGLPIVVDPKYRNFFAYRRATVFKPNRRELEAALGASVDVDHPESIPSILERLDVDHLLLTLGEHGMAIFGRGGEAERIPTTAREVYDVVGAGDTVTAYLASMLAAGASVTEAAVVANYAAGVEVGKLGAATVSAEEVLEAYSAHVGDGASS